MKGMLLMKCASKAKCCCVAIALFLLAAAVPVQAQRVETAIDMGWRFEKSDVPGAQNPGFDDSGWESVDIPHCYNALDATDGGYDYHRGKAWYRKSVAVSSAQSGKRVFLHFGAVGKAADVYLNGTLVGRHEGAYAAFCFDVTDAVAFGGNNTIAVCVDNSKSIGIAPEDGPSSKHDFPNWGGIVRSVKMVYVGPMHITLLDYAGPGVYVATTNVSETLADVSVKTKVRNATGVSGQVSVEVRIYDQNDDLVQTMIQSDVLLAAGTTTDVVLTTQISNPHLWDGRQDPYLYRVVAQVKDGADILDEVTQPMGLRYFSLDPNSGFHLNGRYYDLHGPCLHEDRQGKGRAISDDDRRQDMQLIYDMGSTWMRLSHYQHAPLIYQIADETGVVLWTEVPLVNGVYETTTFRENLKQQLTELIRQNYNHPSVCFWGLFNEHDVSTTLVSELNDLAHQEDPGRYTTAATHNGKDTGVPDAICWNRYMGWYGGKPSDIGPWCDNYHSSNPSYLFGISEYGAGASINHHELPPRQPSAGGEWHPEEYQSYFHEQYWKQFETRPYVWNKSIWHATDFGCDWRDEGDRPGVNDKGLTSYDRTVKKDAYYWYQANWATEPMVHITSRRYSPRFDRGLEVKVYSNCDTVELFVNGYSRGVATGSDRIFTFAAVDLNPGQNMIAVTGHKAGQTCQDQCIIAYVHGTKWDVAAVTASASESGNPPEHTIDGYLNTRWSAEGNHWIKYDLGEVREVTHVYISFYRGMQRIYPFSVLASDDDVNWATIQSDLTSSGGNGMFEAIDVPDFPGRFVRIDVQGNNENAWSSIQETMIHGPGAPICTFASPALSALDGDEDCRITLADLSLLCQEWLDCGLVPAVACLDQ